MSSVDTIEEAGEECFLCGTKGSRIYLRMIDSVIRIRHFNKEHRLAVLEEIGRGNFSRVLLAKHTKGLFVVKVSELNDVYPGDHPNTVKHYASYAYGEKWMIFMEDCRKVNLASLFKVDRYRIAKDVADAVKFLHGTGYVHRDIKLDNVLSRQDRFKLGDFGLTSKEEKTSAIMNMSLAPPEVFIHKNATWHRSCDIFQLGRLFQMLELYSLHELIRKMVSPFAEKRPTIEEVLQTIEANNAFEVKEWVIQLNINEQSVFDQVLLLRHNVKSAEEVASNYLGLASRDRAEDNQASISNEFPEYGR